MSIEHKVARKSDTHKLIGTQIFQVRDKFGKIRKQWQENKFGKYVRILTGKDLQGLFFLGHWSDKVSYTNLITDDGLAGVASRINGAGAEAAFTYLAVGIGATAANKTDSTLESEIVDSGLARNAATATRITTTETDDTAQLDYTWSVTGTKAVTEAGALNAGAAGVLLGRQVFSAVNVQNGDTLQVTYKFAVS